MRIIFLGIATLLSLGLAASGPAEAAGPQVLGLEIGSATVVDVRAAARDLGGNETDRGTSAITDGPLMKFNGSFGLEGAKNASFIFDRSGHLVAVSLTVAKHRYDPIMGVLKGKYRLLNEVRPFVGNRSATLASGDVEIRVDAPHLSFDMSLMYATQAFWSQLAAWERKNDEERGRQQATRL